MKYLSTIKFTNTDSNYTREAIWIFKENLWVEIMTKFKSAWSNNLKYRFQSKSLGEPGLKGLKTTIENQYKHADGSTRIETLTLKELPEHEFTQIMFGAE